MEDWPIHSGQLVQEPVVLSLHSLQLSQYSRWRCVTIRVTQPSPVVPATASVRLAVPAELRVLGERSA